MERRFVLLLAICALTGCASNPRAPASRQAGAAVEIDRLRDLVGCWVGTRADGRTEHLVITREDWGYRLSSDAPLPPPQVPSCRNATPFYSIEPRETGLTAYSLLPGEHWGWTVRLTDRDALFEPDYAPTWLRLRRLAPDRIEWSSANRDATGKSLIDATVLMRTPMP